MDRPDKASRDQTFRLSATGLLPDVYTHVTALELMKTQYYTATSLDGFIATEDDRLSGYSHMAI